MAAFEQRAALAFIAERVWRRSLDRLLVTLGPLTKEIVKTIAKEGGLFHRIVRMQLRIMPRNGLADVA